MTAALSLVPDEPEQVMLDPAAGFWMPAGELPMAAAARRKMARATRWRPKTDEDRRMLAAARWRNPLRVRRTVRGAGDLLEWRAPARRGPARAPAVRPKRAPSSPAVAPAPIRPAGMRVLSEEIVLPRSRQRKAAVPRRMLAGESHESLGNAPLTRAEREELARDLEALGDVRFGPPADDRDCPRGPCPRVGCRHHVYLEVKGDRTILNWPGRHVDELEETCSLRAARAAAIRRQESERHDAPAMSYPEVGRLLNLTAETIRIDEKNALAKLRAAGIHLGPRAD